MKMLRLSDCVRISASSNDAIIERTRAPSLIFPGEGARLRSLVEFLRTPRLEPWLRQTLAHEHPQLSKSDLIQRLIDEEVLVDWDLGPQLTDLHQRTTSASEWEVVNPACETARSMREYAGDRPIDLVPAELSPTSLAQALNSRRTVRRFSGRAATETQLATLLAMGAGMGKRPDYPDLLTPCRPPSGRTYPSAGALYPVETLIYPLRVEGLGAGFYYYQALSNRLVEFAPSLPVENLISLLTDNPIGEASLLFLFFLDFSRPSLGKYGEKAYRLALLEAGHIAQNVLLVATSMDLDGLPICGFYDKELSLSAGLRFPQEAVIYVIAIGKV